MKQFSSTLLILFFSQYCEAFVLYNCARVCSRWRKIIHNRVDISLGKEDLKIVNYSNHDEILLNDFTYIIENYWSEDIIGDDFQLLDEENEDNKNDELTNSVCDCNKLISSHSNIVVRKISCSTMDCSCFARNYHNGKHFLKPENGLLDLDYSFPIIECSDDCSCDSTRCRNRITPIHYLGTIDKPLYLFSIGECVGFGVKCKNFIQKGEFISEYIGKVLSDKESNEILNSSIQDKHHYLLIIKEYFHISQALESKQKYETRRLNIDAEKFGNVSRFFNHSCDPNLTWRVLRTCSEDHPRLFFFAAKDIPENTELTFDYGEGNTLQNNESANLQFSQRKCQCKSQNCKGFLPLVSIK
ncbi:set domain-containing protein [Naegleria gruberi]|uniref:Set domain-containing protein n=1 Tax=Naegleria gruberi TaxID=5762 RepID=D2VSN5_NAEGR|nr:set domain-containing protein [Naegleria gruberi]EFC40221.1 set domain-containing protein [Naegleria gruberi]|eukprot:XP_002672965.1 set domain-containing protein [Naegleria gruberi strain NEG-M]